MQGYRVSATWYQGTSRLDALRTRRTVGFQEGAVKVRAPRGWLAGACKGLPTTGSSKVVRSRFREESEVASICGPARSSQGSPGSPYCSLRLPHPVSMVLNSLQARFSDSSSAGTKQVGRTPLVLWRWPTCISSQVTENLAPCPGHFAQGLFLFYSISTLGPYVPIPF